MSDQVQSLIQARPIPANDNELNEDDEEIDIGSYIGLLEDEEVFGTIIEFDDDEGLVTIEEDGTGDLVTGYQDDMFLDDEMHVQRFVNRVQNDIKSTQPKTVIKPLDADNLVIQRNQKHCLLESQ